MNPLKSIIGSIVSGVVISVILILVYKDGVSHPGGMTVWVHALAGVTWVGLLYYFNFVQLPGVAQALGELKTEVQVQQASISTSHLVRYCGFVGAL